MSELITGRRVNGYYAEMGVTAKRPQLGERGGAHGAVAWQVPTTPTVCLTSHTGDIKKMFRFSSSFRHKEGTDGHVVFKLGFVAPSLQFCGQGGLG